MKPLTFAFSFLLATIAAQDASAPKTKPTPAPKDVEARLETIEPVTAERLEKACADVRIACKEVLGADIESLPPLKLVTVSEMAEVITEENLPIVALRQPDPDKAAAEAKGLGAQMAAFVYAKYAWSTKSFLVVAKTWEENARLLARPQMTSDHALRAVMVHEFCHALDDAKFDLGKRLLEATSNDAVSAFNAVLEGHAQLVARRVCKVRGWSDGFDAFTGSIGALPESARGDNEVMAMVRRATVAAMETAYVDGEKFVKAVVDARPETGRADVFTKPPKDGETILQPQWYLDPKTRPASTVDPEPGIDAFVASFDGAVWSSNRTSPTVKQIATGLTLLPKADVDAVTASMRSVRLVQLAPTAAPQSKMAILVVIEFDSEESAKRWVELSGVLSDKKDEAMREGQVRITASKTTKLEDGPVRGLLQEKTMQVGPQEFGVVSIDTWRGRCVVETVYSGEPPPRDEHVKAVETVLDAITRKK